MRLANTLIFLFFTQIIFGQNQSGNCIEFKGLKIVVIGSSTAQGAGASVPDSAWVNQFRKFVEEINPENEVINLCLLYTSPSPRDRTRSRMPSSA